MKNKEIIIDLLKTVQRAGIEDLISYLENSDFFEAPASTKYHLNEEGGLAKHSLNVYYNLKKMCSANISNDSIILVSLLHDLCKTGFYKKATRNIQNADGKWVAAQTYIVDEDLILGHGEKSVMIIQKYLDLTAEEMLAIRWHMGGFVPKEEQNHVSKVFNQCELAILLHIADLKSTYIDERM